MQGPACLAARACRLVSSARLSAKSIARRKGGQPPSRVPNSAVLGAQRGEQLLFTAPRRRSSGCDVRCFGPGRVPNERPSRAFRNNVSPARGGWRWVCASQRPRLAVQASCKSHTVTFLTAVVVHACRTCRQSRRPRRRALDTHRAASRTPRTRGATRSISAQWRTAR